MKELKKYREYWKELVHIENILSLLHWDSEVLIPEAARTERAEQIAYLSKLYHTKYVSSELDDILASLFQALNSLDLNDEEKFILKKELEVLNHDRYRAKKLRTELVEELSRITNLAIGIWANAKKNKNFSEFAPTLQKIILLVQEKADQYSYNTERYDALLEDYEIGVRASELEELFKHLKNSLIPLINQFQTYPNPFLKPVHKELQYFFNKKLSVLLGLPENSHRLDTSQHPFSTSLGANDKRITTRYDEVDPLSSVFAVLHETGHALYEYGLSQSKNYPSPLTVPASYGVHESQSRLWENQIGRSRPFWEFMYPTLLRDFNIYHYDLPFEKLYNYVNSVSRSKIRVKADQVTYNLHIILRFEIERELIKGSLLVKDLPEVWNSKMKEFFDLEIENDAEGVLQDIHWSGGSFGYFPTYTLGNIYAAQLFSVFLKTHQSFWDDVRSRGDFSSLVKWLTKAVYSQGKIYAPKELIKHATGEYPDSSYLEKYLKSKLRELSE